MRRLALVLALLLVPGLARSATRAPEVCVVIFNDTQNMGDYLWGLVRPQFEAAGIRTFTVRSTASGFPGSQRWYTKKGFAARWGRSRDFDGLALIGYDYSFPTGGARVDSATLVASGYPDFPVVSLGTRNGFGLSSGVCSLGVRVATPFAVPRTSPFLCGVANNYRFPSGTAAGERAAIMASQDTLTALIPSVQKILTSHVGQDSVIVWRKAFPQGGWTCAMSASTIQAQAPDMFSLTVAFWRFVADLPDTVRPMMPMRWSLYIDDGMKRAAKDQNQGAMVPGNEVFIQPYADSLKRRGVPFALGVENSTDTLNAPTLGSTRFAVDMEIWDSQQTRYFPHSHSGDGGTSNLGTGNASLSGVFADVYGGARARNCDPTAPTDTTLYWLSKAQLDALASRVGWNRVERVVAAPTDDVSPLNFGTTCSYNQILSSYKRAGYVNVRISGSTVHGGGDPGGTWGNVGMFDTDYGPIALVKESWAGYIPAFGDTAHPEVSQRFIWFRQNWLSYFPGTGGYFQTNDTWKGPSGILVQHVRNYQPPGRPGWIAFRDLDDSMRFMNSLAGYEQWKWVWPSEMTQPAWSQQTLR